MSSHNPHPPGWHPYHQNQSNTIQQDDYQRSGNSNKSQNQGMETHMQAAKYRANMLPEYNNSQRLESSQYNAYSPYPTSTFHGASPDMQYMMQMMIHLRNQLDQLNQLIVQNNQLLQSMHDQEDTKCIQGSGGGAVIVRM